MDFLFDNYNKLEDVDFYLCNPDGRELYSIIAYDRNITLRFNSISELTFSVNEKIENSSGNVFVPPYYSLLQTKRLIHLSNNLGWYQISKVTETDNGLSKTKSITAESIDASLKNVGFITQEKVYKFYNPSDPTDATYIHDDEGSIPSVVGQLYQQLGITINLASSSANSYHDYWTIVSIDPELVYDPRNPLCRTFSDDSIFGYDFLVNKVEEAFGIITIFDIEHRTISFRTVDRVTQHSNICLSFDNLIDEIIVDEDANDITTVLNCESDGLDITGVNPTGTNYVTNFDYYMDSVNGEWMSPSLINAITSWNADVDDKKTTYRALVEELYRQTKNESQLQAIIKERQVATEDLNTGVAKYAELKANGPTSDSGLSGIIHCEDVPIVVDWVHNPGGLALDSVNQYLWSYTILSRGDGSDPVVIRQPAPLYKYDEVGSSVSLILDYYLACDEETVVTRSTPGWSGIISGFSESAPLLWHYRAVTCTNGTLYSDPEIVAVYHDEETVRNADGTTTIYPGLTSIASISYRYCVDERESGIFAYPIQTVDHTSIFRSSPFTASTELYGATHAPNYNDVTKLFSYSSSEQFTHADVATLFSEVEQDPDWKKDGTVTTAHLYFVERPNGTEPSGYTNYCLLTGRAVRVADTSTITGYSFRYVCDGFKRFTSYDNVKEWWANNERYVKTLRYIELFAESNARAVSKMMSKISSPLNIFTYLKSLPGGDALARELRCYWIEGTYSNDNLSEVDNSEYTDSLILSRQLMEAAQEEIKNVSQPTYSFSVTAKAALKCYELREFIKGLTLGQVVTIERGDDDWFYPALLEMSFNLDGDDFSLSFANKTRLQDYNYLFADLVSTSSSTSRQVSSNWSALTSYENDKGDIKSLTINPLDSALRAAKSALADVTNQDFQIGTGGVLGRARGDGDDFSDEQLRIVNNLLAFTDDGWDTVKTALGKIRYTDDGQEKTAYGLVADAIIGSLLIGNKLKIENDDSTIVVDKDGIRISKTGTGGSAQQTVFSASTNGDLFAKGRADISGSIDGDMVSTDIIKSHTGQTGISLDANIVNTNLIKASLTARIASSGEVGPSGEDISGHPVIEIRLTNPTTGAPASMSSNKDFRVRYMDGYGGSHSVTVSVYAGQSGGTFIEPTFKTLIIYGSVFANTNEPEMTFETPDASGQTTVSYTGALTSSWDSGDGIITIQASITSGGFLTPAIDDITLYVQYELGQGSPVFYGTILIQAGSSSGVFTASAGRNATKIYFMEDIFNHAYEVSGSDASMCTFSQTQENQPGSGIVCKGTFVPSQNATTAAGHDLGNTSYRWHTLYAATSPNIGSARSFKSDIVDLDSEKVDEMYRLLKPRKFKLLSGESSRYHYGFILDELGSAIENSGMTANDCAAYCLDDPNVPDGPGGIRYEEIIALNTLQIQKLQARIDELEKQNNTEDA